MSEPTDHIRRLAFDAMYQLPHQEEPSSGAAPLSPEAVRLVLASLTPEERERAHNVAARRLAFQLLYELDAAPPADPPSWMTQSLARVTDLGPVAADRVRAMVLGSFDARAQADAEFTALAPEWPTHRQPGVDRALLRLAHWELTTKAVAPRIAINEAVELARHFSTDKSPPFINALLDKVARRVAPADELTDPQT